MARKLLRFTTIPGGARLGAGVVAVAGVRHCLQGPGNGWMHAKLTIVLLVVGYHHACARAGTQTGQRPPATACEDFAGSTDGC